MFDKYVQSTMVEFDMEMKLWKITNMLSFSRPFATWLRKSNVNICKQT